MTTLEKTWQYQSNQSMDNSTTNNSWKNQIWWFKAFLKGDIASYTTQANATVTTYQGLWTCYYSCDGVTAGTAADGYDRWGNQGSTTANSGSAASLVSGATITGAIRITGVTGLSSSLGNYLTITGAATSANNSATNTPWKIVKVNSATDVEIYNPNGVTGDANNGAIVWAERGQYTTPGFANTGGAANPIVCAANGSAHSWFVLKSPAALGPWYVIIDCSSASQPQIGQMVFCKTAPTGGTTTARPTSVDENANTNWTNTQINPNSGTIRMHGSLSTDGYFNMMGSQDNNGSFYFTWIFQTLAETKSIDNYTALMYFRGNNTTPSISQLQNGTYLSMKNRNGLANVFPYACNFGYNASNGSATIFVNAMTTTDFTDGLYDDLPIYIYVSGSVNPAYKSLRGRFIDIRWCPVNIPNGAIESSQASPTAVVNGALWMPYNTVPLI